MSLSQSQNWPKAPSINKRSETVTAPSSSTSSEQSEAYKQVPKSTFAQAI